MTTTRVALVTGAGSGMGRRTAEVFLDRGWTVLAIDLTPVEIDGTDGRLVPIAIDVRDRDAVESALAAPPAGCRRIDPRGGQRCRHLPAVDAGDGDHRAVLPGLRRQCPRRDQHHGRRPAHAGGLGHRHFASVDGFTVSPGQLVYGASKAAVIMITKATALELAPRRIRVNAIAPGWVDTPGNAATGRMQAAAASIPLGRVARPSEIAEWAWLLTGGGAATFMTGETVTLSGGDVIR
jgi:3-oxoacyl-[acyl-carrier protein] reductase